MKSCTCFITMTIILMFATPVFSQGAVLDMTVWPGDLGWTYETMGSGSASLSGGVLTMITPESAKTYFKAPAALWSATASDPGGWEIEADVQITSSATASQGAAAFSVTTGVHAFIFYIHTTAIRFAGNSWVGTSSYAMDTTDAVHQYVLSGVGNSVDVRVDGVLVISVSNTTPNATTPYLFFGDLLYGSASTHDWTYVGFGPVGVVGVEASSWGEVKALFR